MTQSRLLHLHVPKTAGTAVRIALQRALNGTHRFFPDYREGAYRSVDREQYDVFSGHFSYDTASKIGGDIIALLRNPVDRFISTYFFWRQLHETGAEVSLNTRFASKFPIEEYVLIRDEPFLLQEFYNSMTWQLACNRSIDQRRKARESGLTDTDILRLAIENANRFSVVGIQEDLADFTFQMRKVHGIGLIIPRVNVTAMRLKAADLSASTIREIHRWVALDIELYSMVSHLVHHRRIASQENELPEISASLDHS